MTGPRMSLGLAGLAYERTRAGDRAGSIRRRSIARRSSLKRAMRTALDWETVTPLDEIPRSSISNRLKRGLRWWKHKQHGGLGMTMTATPDASHRKSRRPHDDRGHGSPSREPGRTCPARAPVILHAPSFAFQAPGGGENQLVQTGMHLEELGVPVRLFSPWTDRLETARLLHLFGMSREGLELARMAQARGVPVVLSPICWYEPRALAALETRLAAKSSRAWRPGACDRWSRRCRAGGASSCSWPMSSCPIRARRRISLIRLFGVARERIRVVPNGVLPSIGIGFAGAVSLHVGERSRSSCSSAGSNRARTRSG